MSDLKGDAVDRFLFFFFFLETEVAFTSPVHPRDNLNAVSNPLGIDECILKAVP